MTIRSMTGFARLRRSLPEGDLTISIKSVNHRALDLHFHMSSWFDPLESAMRNAIKEQVSRGHVDVRCSLHREAAVQSLKVNNELLAAYVRLFSETEKTFGPLGAPSLNDALRLPGILVESHDDEISESLQAAILDTLAAALTEFNTQREREGKALVEQMKAYNASIREAAGVVRELRTHILPYLKQRVETRVVELLGGQAIEPSRLAQEASFLADRGDIEEEVTRLLTHTKHLDTLLSSTGDAGKKIDFLLQEMNREANTILSKSGNAGDHGLALTQTGLGIKTDIERIREQSLNLE